MPRAGGSPVALGYCALVTADGEHAAPGPPPYWGPPPPQHPQRQGLPWWAWLLIAVGAILLVSVPALGFLSYLNHSIRETSPDQPFIDGPRQTPEARTPISCPTECFDVDDAAQLRVTAEEVAELAIRDELYGVGKFESSTVAAVAPTVERQWLDMGGDPECAFMPTNAPYIATEPDSASDDPVSWVQTWRTGDETMDLAAREFPSSALASAFMRDLHSRVAACPWQDLNSPAAGGMDTTLVEITAQAAVTVPDSVAAVGWVREGTPGARWRSYVWDLQRGNLIVQVRVLTDGRITEPHVAQFTESMAVRLGELPGTRADR